MQPTVYITTDFETRSAADLKKVGAYVYAEHPTTDVLCLVFCGRNGKLFRWLPGDPVPHWLAQAIADGAVFEAHNQLFERAIWEIIMVPRYGFPAIPENQWLDTMAVCARKALPLDLDTVSNLLDLTVVKDKEGHAALMKVCKPSGKTMRFIEKEENPALFERVYTYCGVDTTTQMHLAKRLGPLEPAEHKVWVLNERMNWRGFQVDLNFAADCQAVYDEATAPLAEAFQRDVGFKPKSPFMKGHLNELLAAAGSELRFPNLQKETVEDALENWDMPENVRNIVEMRTALTSASVAKLAAMRRCTGSDGRARGLQQYHAATTGRTGGRLLQPTNFPRGSVDLGKDADGKTVPPWEFLVPAIKTRDAEMIGMMLAHLEDNISPQYRHLIAPVSAVTSALRHCLVAAPGKKLVAGDFSTIEARIVLALAGQHDRLKLIAEGGDPYCDLAAMVVGHPVNKKDHPLIRQDIGKPAVLGCGFQMGHEKFHKKYMKRKPLELAQSCVKTYREDWAPKVPKLWYGLQEAANRAVWDRRPAEYAGVEYRIEDLWLTARLPSGRKLYYFNPRKKQKAMPWSTPEEPDIRAAWCYTAKKMGRMVTVDAYGGLLTENVVQALARDIMVTQSLVAEENGFPLVLTVYDEIVAETEETTDKTVLKQIMLDGASIAWVKALGIPIGAEEWEGDRYRK